MKMQPIKIAVSLLREKRLYLLAAITKTSPQLLACLSAGIGLHLFALENIFLSFLGVTKAIGFALLIVLSVILVYEAWKNVRET